ncbi:hypothetical protein [Gimesia sp.]|uniref:hypothetical protein n=1 Tax=Gimesia sp. TaxID=2024833 RepID=UPI003A901058
MKTQYAILFLVALFLPGAVSCSSEPSIKAQLKTLEYQTTVLEEQIEEITKVISDRDQKVLGLLTANQKQLALAVDALKAEDTEAAKIIKAVMQDQQKMRDEISGRLKDNENGTDE